MADSRAVRESALEEGEASLNEAAISHNYLWFYLFAMEALLRVKEWDRVEHYANALETYTKSEPLLLMDFFVARGRALANFGRGMRDVAHNTATTEAE